MVHATRAQDAFRLRDEMTFELRERARSHVYAYDSYSATALMLAIDPKMSGPIGACVMILVYGVFVQHSTAYDFRVAAYEMQIVYGIVRYEIYHHRLGKQQDIGTRAHCSKQFSVAMTSHQHGINQIHRNR